MNELVSEVLINLVDSGQWPFLGLFLTFEMFCID